MPGRMSQRRQQLMELRRLLRCARDFMGCLGVHERQSIRDKMVSVIVATAKQKGLQLPAALEDADVVAVIDKMIEDVEAATKAAYKKRRDRKPANQERDTEIVRLRDIEKLTFSKIPRRLLPRWSKPNGKPLSVGAVEIAYRRMKALPTDN